MEKSDSNNVYQYSNVSPHDVVICILLRTYVHVQDPNRHSIEQCDRLDVPLKENTVFELACFLSNEVNCVNSVCKSQNYPLKYLFSRLQKEISQSSEYKLLKDFVLKTLNLIQSPDALEDIFHSFEEILVAKSSNLDKVLVHPHHLISRESNFGLYLRRVILQFSRGFFSELSRLYEHVDTYIKEYNEGYHSASLTKTSSQKIRMYLQDKIKGFEKKIGVEDLWVLEIALVDLFKMNPQHYQIHFVRYMNFLYHREFQGAFETLHQYHDYCLQEYQSSEHSQLVIQYASLNLAALHYHFGSIQASRDAIEETIRIAQQHGDHACVAFALAWLMRLYVKTADPCSEQLIQDCIRRAQEDDLPLIATLANLTSVEYDLMGGLQDRQKLPTIGGSNLVTRPISIWLRLIERASSRGLDLSYPKIESWYGLPHFLRFFGLQGKAALLQSNTWKLFGHRTLEDTFAFLQIHSYVKTCNKEDLAIAINIITKIRLSMNDAPNRENVYIPLLKFLIKSGEKFQIQKEYAYIQAFGITMFTWLHLSGQYKRASHYLEILQSISSKESDIHAYIEVKILEIKFHDSLHNFQKALDTCYALMELCKTRNYSTYEARILLLQGKIIFSACFESPMAALSSVLGSLSMCKDLNLDSLMAEAHVLLGNIMLCLGAIGQAQNVARQYLAHILEHCALDIQGDVFLLLAKCELAGQSGEMLVNNKIMQYLENAFEKYKAVEAMSKMKEVIYLKARIHHENDNHKDRDLEASEFIRLEKLLIDAKSKDVLPSDLNLNFEEVVTANIFFTGAA